MVVEVGIPRDVQLSRLKEGGRLRVYSIAGVVRHGRPTDECEQAVVCGRVTLDRGSNGEQEDGEVSGLVRGDQAVRVNCVQFRPSGDCRPLFFGTRRGRVVQFGYVYEVHQAFVRGLRVRPTYRLRVLVPTCVHYQVLHVRFALEGGSGTAIFSGYFSNVFFFLGRFNVDFEVVTYLRNWAGYGWNGGRWDGFLRFYCLMVSCGDV